jgi:co-chaperonin GroES (HSP10)
VASTKLVIPKSGPEGFLEKIRKLNGLPDIEVFHHHILVAKYIRTTVGTSGRIIAASQTQKEDEYQGKVGLVIKIGPGAFLDDGAVTFRGISVKPDDWVLYRNSDGWDMDYVVPGESEKIHLRWLEDAHIKGRAQNPDSIW